MRCCGFIFLLAQFVLTFDQRHVDHEYRIKEEVPVGTQVGDLIQDVAHKLLDHGLVKSTTKNPNSLREIFVFKVRNYEDNGVSIFEVRQDGRLYTAGRLDRDQLCPVYGSPSNYPGLGILKDTAALTSMVVNQKGAPKSVTAQVAVCPISIEITVSLRENSRQVKSDKLLDSDLQNFSFKSPHVRLRLQILVEDVNDNPPYWPGRIQRYQISFRDGDPIGERRNLPPASDLDAGINGMIRYELSNSPKISSTSAPFGLTEHPVDGLYIYTTKQIDREEKPSYQLYLTAIDRASVNEADFGSARQFTSTLVIDVHIEDINDNAPQFTQPVFTTSTPIPETTPVGKTVLVLNATDSDSGVNGAFHFGFSKEHSWLPLEALARQYFEVRSNGHVVVRRPLNVDQMDPSQNFELSDRGLMVASQLPADRQSRGLTLQFRFRVIVEDEAVRPYSKSTEATVIILVKDENDESPIIRIRPNPESGDKNLFFSRVDANKYTYVSVLENKPVGTGVVVVQVYDPDFEGTDPVECRSRSANFTISLVSSSESLQLENSGGIVEYQLLTAVEIDREATPVQPVSIICKDTAGHYAETNITVHISDQNDNAPHFLRREFHFHLEENAPPGTQVRSSDKSFLPAAFSYSSQSLLMHGVVAVDPDFGQNAQITYRLIENGANSTRFSIDPHTGAITNAAVFDYEAVNQYALQALAVDQGQPTLTGTATVKIHIDDVNDNSPQFNQLDYSFHIPENQPRTTKIGQVYATDLDSDIHGPLGFYLSNDRDALAFRIDCKTGIIRSRQPLDREEQSRYVFRVLVRDKNPLAGQDVSGGTIQRTSTATVTVVVTDMNDNWPVFISPNATANTLAVAVDETLGHKLAYIHAEDKDEGDNGLVSYHIKSGNNNGLFGLDPTTGLLYLAGTPDKDPIGTHIIEPLHPKNESSTSGDSASGWSGRHFKPSFHLLAIEACDQGKDPEPRCTLFNNLKILVKNAPDRDSETVAKRERLLNLRPSEMHDKDADALTGHGGSNAIHQQSEMHSVIGEVENGMIALGTNGSGDVRNHANEVIIICLSLVFAVVLLATLALICLARRRSLASFIQKRSLNGDCSKQDLGWQKKMASDNMNVESPTTLIEVRENKLFSQNTMNCSVSGMLSEPENHDLPYPMSNITSPNLDDSHINPLSEGHYQLLSRTIDGRRRQLTPQITPDASQQVNLGGPLSPLNARVTAFTRRLDSRSKPQINGLSGNGPSFTVISELLNLYRLDDYQTLDYLGLVSPSASNRYPHLYDTNSRVAYSPIPIGSSRRPGIVNEAHLQKSGAVFLTHMNRLTDYPVQREINNLKTSEQDYRTSHSHSLSQPQPMDIRYATYSMLTPTLNRQTIPNVRAYGEPQTVKPRSYHPIANSTTNVNRMLYSIRRPRYPVQSHTYYDIRQTESVQYKPFPKSKSQQLPRDNRILTKIDSLEDPDSPSYKNPKRNDNISGKEHAPTVDPEGLHASKDVCNANTFLKSENDPWESAEVTEMNKTSSWQATHSDFTQAATSTTDLPSIRGPTANKNDQPRYTPSKPREASFV
ncbi:unnamed protein product [Calicophoron daubneyi]|uniref:Cadherin domain-containing protein n=1 Tax=Calicophoron daubneyi TaxID=300641 RepID=A0AAV2TNV7_CALDB